MSSMQTINEACSCGATFTTSAAWSASAQSAVRDWREGHKHTDAPVLAPRLAEAKRERDDWREAAERNLNDVIKLKRSWKAAEAKVAAVEALADEWGITAQDGDFVGDEDFAESIRDSGAWRFARDLRAALGESR